MGEYATTASGETVKIGTCENLYYLRWDQHQQVIPEAGQWSEDLYRAYRFRFPFPDEDRIPVDRMQEIEDFDRMVGVPFYRPDHRRESYSRGECGAQFLVQQRWIEGGRLVPVLECECGGRYRLEEWSEVTAVVDALLAAADEVPSAREGRFLGEVANRVIEGYNLPDVAASTEREEAETALAAALAGAIKAGVPETAVQDLVNLAWLSTRV